MVFPLQGTEPTFSAQMCYVYNLGEQINHIGVHHASVKELLVSVDYV